jgi:hypothetical protein
MSGPPSPHVRRRLNPRISANDLARYMVASQTGQIGIIKRSRESGSAPRIRYSLARQELRGFLCDPARTSRHLVAIRNRFEQRADVTSLDSWAQEDARLSLDLIDAFIRMENKIAGAKFEAAPRQQSPLVLAGVDVSVYLDVMMTRERSGKAEVGGILFRLSKADDGETAASKRQDMGVYAATLALMQVQTNLANGRIPHHQLSASFDIQAGDVHYAPQRYTQRTQNLENACRFIASMWDSA